MLFLTDKGRSAVDSEPERRRPRSGTPGSAHQSDSPASVSGPSSLGCSSSVRCRRSGRRFVEPILLSHCPRASAIFAVTFFFSVIVVCYLPAGPRRFVISSAERIVHELLKENLIGRHARNCFSILLLKFFFWFSVVRRRSCGLCRGSAPSSATLLRFGVPRCGGPSEKLSSLRACRTVPAID